MQTVNRDFLIYERAGSDYLGVAWSANIRADETTKDFVLLEPITIIHGHSQEQVVYPIKKEKMDGKMTWLVTDEHGAMMFTF